MLTDKLSDLKTLSLEEKLTLLDGLWNKLDPSPGEPPARADHLRCLEESAAGHSHVSLQTPSWEEFEARLAAHRPPARSLSSAETFAARIVWLMEVLWTDLCENHGDEMPVPDWHAEVLAERRREEESGEAVFLDWEDVKAELRQLMR